MKSVMSRCKTSFSRVTSLLTRGLPLVLLLGLLSGQALAVCYTSGFEDEDGNLSFDSSTCVNNVGSTASAALDWNDFAPVVWSGTFPYRTTSASYQNWAFTGLEDDQATNSDTAFSGGTKQDDNCAVLKGGKSPNKDDMKRAYVSSNTVNGHVIVNLAWVRIPQNTTSPSAHIGFEFNQGETACPAGSDGLVERTEGDMLVVYDFEGGATDTPTITLRRWVVSGVCEVGSDSPPCWGTSTDLTSLGYAEARVNTTSVVPGPIEDALAPDNPPDMLEYNEFGEAGLDLTAAGVFSTNECLAFGKVFAVSRSSGNSATAQMKDLVGPGDVNIANCGRVIIHKVTNPVLSSASSPSFTYTALGGLNPASFALKSGETQDYGPDVFAGTYSVTEDSPLPTGWDFTSLDCSASSLTNGSSYSTSSMTVNFDVKPLDTIDCTYTNTARGYISANKVVVNQCSAENGQFSLQLDGVTQATGGNGTSFGPTQVSLSSHTIGEVEGDASTALSSYTATISGDCTASGAVSVGAGDSKSCTITNVRKPTIKINKVVTGGNLNTFDLLIDDGNTGTYGHETEAQGNGGTTGAVLISTVKDTDSNGAAADYGPVKLAETVANGAGTGTVVNPISGFLSFWTCDDTSGSNGVGTSVVVPTLLPGEAVTCTLYNIPYEAAACTPPTPPTP